MAGFTLIEMMVSLTIAMLISVGVMFLYAGQVQMFSQVARKEFTVQEAQSAFDMISSVLRQAEVCREAGSCAPVQTVAVTYPTGVTNPNDANTGNPMHLTGDALTVDFTIPSGYNIWPNTTSPYTNNAIRLIWSGDALTISNGASTADPASGRVPVVLAGGSANTKIINFDVWPMVVDNAGAVTRGVAATDKPTAGYRLTLSARVGAADGSYTNPRDPTGALKNYRTVTYERIVLPRNW